MSIVFVLTPYVRIHRKSKEIAENRPLRAEEIRRNPATNELAKLFAYAIAGSIEFQRAAVLAIGLVRKGTVDDLRLRFFGNFCHVFSPHDADYPKCNGHTDDRPVSNVTKKTYLWANNYSF